MKPEPVRVPGHSLCAEFRSSFGAFVSADSDVRKSMLMAMLEQPVEILVLMAESHDLAAMLTSSACVVNNGGAQRIASQVNAWQTAREEAEAEGEDPDEVELTLAYPVMDMVKIAFDPEVPKVAEFFATVSDYEGGEALLGQIVACLLWAQGIEEMIPELYEDNNQRSTS